MKRRSSPVIIVALFVSLQSIVVGGAEEPASVSYYEQLRSLTARRNSSRIRPKAAERDIDLIEVDKALSRMRQIVSIEICHPDSGE